MAYQNICNRTVMFARPEVADQCHRIAMGFIKNSIISTQCATNKA